MKAPFHFLLFFFCLLSFSVAGQWSFGIKGSYSRSNQDIPFEYLATDYQYTKSSNKVEGYGLAVSLYYHLNKYWQIGVEPGVVKRGSGVYSYGAYMLFDCGDFEGFSFEECSPTPINETRVYAQYAQVPLLMKFNVALFKNRLSIFLKGGGSVSWLSSAQNQTTNVYLDQPSVFQSVNLKEEGVLNRWDLGVQMGSGINIKAGPGSVLLETTIYQGFKDFYNYRKSWTRSFEYSLGYQIDL